MSLASDNLTPIVEAVGWLLLHSIWQFTIVAGLVSLMLLAARGVGPRVRYWIAMIGLCVMLAFPGFTYLLMQRGASAIDDSKPQSAAVPIDSANPQIVSSSEMQIANLEPSEIAKAQAIRELSIREASARANRFSAAAFATTLRPWLAQIVLLWIVGVFCFSIRPTIGMATIFRLRSRGTSQVPSGAKASLKRACDKMGVSRSVTLLQSTLVKVPAMLGVLRPTILIPASILTGLSPVQLEALIAHEVAHIRRHDYLANLFQTFVESVFFYHPAVWWLSGFARQQRELCCDDLVVQTMKKPVDYAEALVAIAALDQPCPTLALGAKGGSLLYRIRRLAEMQNNKPKLATGSAVSLVLPAAILITLGSFLMTTNFSFGDAADDDASFGVEAQGIRCRVTTVHAKTSEAKLDQAVLVSQYQTDKEVTLLVELLNVSDQPIRLFAPPKNETNKRPGGHFLLPFFVDFEIEDRDGAPAGGPQRSFDSRFPAFLQASLSTIQPGAAHRFLVRPAELDLLMARRLPQGDYRLKLRFRGVNDELRESIAKTDAKHEMLQAWQHTAESKTVEFSIAANAANSAPPRLIWGQAVDGLVAAVDFQGRNKKGELIRSPSINPDATIIETFHVKNVSDQRITFVSETSRQGDAINVVNAAGEKVPVKSAFYSGWPIDVRWTLKPGEVAKLPVLQPSISAIKEDGRYEVSFDIRFNSRKLDDEEGNPIFPRHDDYQSVLRTGTTTIFLRGNETDSNDEADGKPSGPDAASNKASQNSNPAGDSISQDAGEKKQPKKTKIALADVLNKKVTASYVNRNFFEILTQLEEEHSISITLDLRKLHAMGVSARTEFSTEASGVTLRNLIRHVALSAGTTVAFEDDGVRVPSDKSRLVIEYDMPKCESEAKLYVQNITTGEELGSEKLGMMKLSVVKQGRFLDLSDLDAGEFRIARFRLVAVAKAGLGKMSRGAYLDSSRVQLKPGQSRKLRLARLGARQVSGRVIGLKKIDGTLGAHLQIWAAGSGVGERPREVFDSQLTDLKGNFITEPLSPGEYTAVVEAYEPISQKQMMTTGIVQPALSATQNFTVSEEGELPNLEIKLPSQALPDEGSEP